jgi:uncharacterized protein with von Willebrand factor type A (vWA) domain
MLSDMTAPKDRTNMNRTPCSPANSILEGDLELAVQQQTLKKLVVAETPEGFYVVAQLKWAGNKEWYLTTRRERTKPRLFKDLKRLNDQLKAAYPTDSVEILRNQVVPEQGKATHPASALPQTEEKAKKTTKKGNL